MFSAYVGYYNRQFYQPNSHHSQYYLIILYVCIAILCWLLHWFSIQIARFRRFFCVLLLQQKFTTKLDWVEFGWMTARDKDNDTKVNNGRYSAVQRSEIKKSNNHHRITSFLRIFEDFFLLEIFLFHITIQSEYIHKHYESLWIAMNRFDERYTNIYCSQQNTTIKSVMQIRRIQTLFFINC